MIPPSARLDHPNNLIPVAVTHAAGGVSAGARERNTQNQDRPLVGRCQPVWASFQAFFMTPSAPPV
jgi:hypothetical protein